MKPTDKQIAELVAALQASALKLGAAPLDPKAAQRLAVRLWEYEQKVKAERA